MTTDPGRPNQMNEHSRRWRLDNAPRHFADCSFDSLPFSDNDAIYDKQQAILEKVMEWGNQAFRDVGSTWLILYGPPGTCKTGLAIAAISSWWARWQVACMPKTARFLDVPAWFIDLQSSYQPGATLRESQILKPILEADAVILDDVGADQKRQHSVWAEQRLGLVLNAAYGSGALVVITTNLTLQELRRTLGEKNWSRSLEVAETISFAGLPDIRPILKQIRKREPQDEQPVELPADDDAGYAVADAIYDAALAEGVSEAEAFDAWVAARRVAYDRGNPVLTISD